MDDIKIDDGSEYNYSRNKGVTYKEIVLSQISRITRLQSVEFHGGYFSEKPVSVGGVTVIEKKYVEDTREAYCNAVNCLYDLMIISFDDEIKEFNSVFQKKKEKLADEINADIDMGKIDEDKGKDMLAWLQRDMFRELNKLMARCNFFEEEEWMDE